MKNKMVLYSVILFLMIAIVSCTVPDTENADRSVQKCSLTEMKEKYFTDWKGSLVCAYSLSKSSGDEKTVQTAEYILGEYYFLSGEHEKAFSHFRNSVKGPDGSVSTASLNYIRKLYLPFENIEEFALFSTKLIDDRFAKCLIAGEAREWAKITGNMDRYDELSLSMNILTHVSILTPGSGKGVAVVLRAPSDTLDPFNHVPEESGQYSFTYEFSLQQDAVLPLFFQTGLKTEITIDGTVVKPDEGVRRKDVFSVIRNGGTYKFTKGDHKIVITAGIYEETDPRIKVFLPDDTVRVSDSMTGAAGTVLKYEPQKDAPSLPFDEFVDINGSEPAGLKVDRDRFIQLFSKVIGSTNPSVLTSGAEIFFMNDDEEKGLSLLKKAVSAYPGLVRPAVALSERTNGSYDSIPDGIDKSLLVSDILSSEGQTAAGLKHSGETFRKYSDIYAAGIYYSLALEEYGDIREALKIRAGLLEKFPGNYTLMESILALAEKMNDLDLRKDMIKRMLRLDPDNIKLKTDLAGTLLAKRNTKSAVRLFREILSVHPQDPGALSGMGDAEMLNGNKWTALEYYSRALITDPENDEIYKKVLYLENGDPSGFFGKYSITDKDAVSIYGTPVMSQANPYEILYDEGLHKVISQNAVISRFRMIMKITDETGCEKLKEIPLSGTLISAKVIRNGSAVNDNWALKDGNIVFKSLKAGDVIDLQYTLVERTASRYQGFGSSWLFGEEGVINRNSVLAFYMPEGVAGSFSVRGKVKDSSLNYNNGTVRIFRSENVFVPKFEKFMPYDSQKFIPGVEYSFVKSWTDIAKWQINFIKQGSVVSDGISAVAKRIYSSNLPGAAAVELLRDFVADRISYLFSDSGIYVFKPEPTDAVLKRMSGDCKDKALLLKVMLNASGIEADYALVRSKDLGPLNKDVPSMQFDHALVYIREQDGFPAGFFVDPSAENDRSPGIGTLHEGVEAFVLKDDTGGYDFRKVISSAKSFSEVTVNPAGTSSIRYSGTDASAMRYAVKSSGDVEKAVSVSLETFSGQSPEIKNVRTAEIPETGEFVVEFSTGTVIPRPAGTLLEEIVKTEGRTYPVDLSVLPGHFRITVISGIKGGFENFTSDSKFLKYTCERYGRDGIAVSVEIKKDTILPEEFAELKKTVINIIEFENKLPVE